MIYRQTIANISVTTASSPWGNQQTCIRSLYDLDSHELVGVKYWTYPQLLDVHFESRRKN